MSGYTPGPWVSYGSGVATEPFGLKPDRTHGYGCGSTFVCCLNDGEYHEYSDPEEQEVNARLIAAAPELLEALIALRDGPQVECVPDNHVQDLIRAAIAKATEAAS